MALRETLAALVGRTSLDGEAPLRIAIALHYGPVIYGNIGAADRLDFTVIGPAVNLVTASRRWRNRSSAAGRQRRFRRGLRESLPSIGMHKLRGLERPHELFAP